MVALDPHLPGERAEHVLISLQSVEKGGGIEARAPPGLISSPLVDVDAIDARKHAPAWTAIHRELSDIAGVQSRAEAYDLFDAVREGWLTPLREPEAALEAEALEADASDSEAAAVDGGEVVE